MKIDKDDLLNSILKSVEELDYIKVKDLPDIDLYMDQLTTFMDNKLKGTKRHEEDKVLTKTMINNYAKNQVLPPPAKKQYSKYHILTLVFIYYFKNILSITDIQKLLQPINDKYYSEDGYSIADIYSEVFTLESGAKKKIINDVKEIVASSKEIFNGDDIEDKEFLQYFAIICGLSFDIYIKKLVVEAMVDELEGPQNKTKASKDKKKDSSKASKKKSSK